MSNPPVMRPVRPEAGPEGCSRPGVSVATARRNVERSARRLRVRCPCVLVADRARNRTALSTRLLRPYRLRRPSHDQRRAVLDVVKALAALRPAARAAGLDDACAQLEGSTYVMAEEARRIFRVDPSSRQTYGEDLVGAITHPLRESHPTRSAAAIALRATLQLLQQPMIDRASLARAITASDLRSRVSLSASRHIRAHRHRRAGITSARSSALHRSTNIRHRVRRECPWSSSNVRMTGRSRSRSRAVGNCSATKRNR